MAWCGGGGGPRGGPSVQCSALPSSAFSSRGPPSRTNGLPLPRLPSLRSLPLSPSSSLSISACLPPFLLPALLPVSLPLSLLSPPAPLRSRTQRGRQAGRQAAASEGRRSGGGGGGGGEGGPAGSPEPAAAPRKGPGVRGQALPLRPCAGRPAQFLDKKNFPSSFQGTSPYLNQYVSVHFICRDRATWSKCTQ